MKLTCSELYKTQIFPAILTIQSKERFNTTDIIDKLNLTDGDDDILQSRKATPSLQTRYSTHQ